MRNTFKWAFLAVVLLLISCTKAEKSGDSSLAPKTGVYGYILPVVDEDVPGTKAKFTPDVTFSFEMGDRINIWSESGTLLIYSVETLTGGGGATFDGGGFDLTEGQTYYSTFPLIANVRDDRTALGATYEGQVQVADNDANHLADYAYMYTWGTCENGYTQFAYHHLSRWYRFVLTLPKTTMTVTELTITADSDIYALKGTINATTGEFTATEMSDTMTLGFDNVTVTDGELNASLALRPFPATNVVVRVKDSEGKVYSTGVIAQAAAPAAGGRRTITATLTEENPATTGKWEKVTTTSQLTSGDYVIVYPAADGYKVFSFEKAMANAQTAAAAVANMHTFAEVAPIRTQLFQTCVNGDYETVEVPADPAFLDIPEDIEPKVAIEATTATGETANGSATLKSTAKNLGFKSVVVALDTDGAATIKGMVNASDFKNICTFLRGHELQFTFTDVMDFVAGEVGMSDASKEDALKAFDGLCRVAKSVMAEHNYLDLMDIDRSTRLMDVFGNHYEFFADASMGYDSDKAYGWINPVGFYVENDGFSAHIPMPSSWWFDLFAESLATGSRDSFVAYWKQFDIDHPEYSQFFSRNSFFGRIAERMIEDNAVTESQFNKIAAINWSKIGEKYQVYADDLNKDPLEVVYLYKKVE